MAILIVETGGVEIVDEPKIDADLKIYFDSAATQNFVDPSFLHYDGRIGIEKRGQSSLSLFPKNGYGMETRESDGSNLNVPLFGWPKENDWVLHGPYSDKTLVRNAFTYKLAGEIMDYAPRIMFCELVIDGSYEGIYLFTEKIKRDNGRVDISKLNPDDNEGDQLTGGYILKFDKGDGAEFGWASDYDPIPGGFQTADFFIHYPKPEDLTEAQGSYIENVFRDFEDVLMSSTFTDSIDGYRKYIDVESFIDFILIQELSGNVDSYRLSTYFYKDRDSIDSRIKMGPVWDYNLAFGNANYCNGASPFGWAWDFNEYCSNDFWVNHVWWDRLLEDDAFKMQFKDTWEEYRLDRWSDGRLSSCIDSLVSIVQPGQERNFERWPVIGEWIWPNATVESSYTREVQRMKTWMLDRAEWIDGAVNDFVFGLEKKIQGNGVLIVPNPSNGDFDIKWNRKIVMPQEVMLFNAQGKIVYRESSSFGSEVNTLSIDLNLPAGVYYYIVDGDDKVVRGSFVVY